MHKRQKLKVNNYSQKKRDNAVDTNVQVWWEKRGRCTQSSRYIHYVYYPGGAEHWHICLCLSTLRAGRGLNVIHLDYRFHIIGFYFIGQGSNQIHRLVSFISRYFATGKKKVFSWSSQCRAPKSTGATARQHGLEHHYHEEFAYHCLPGNTSGCF